MPSRLTGRVIGVLFLAAFLCYGVGTALAPRPIGWGLMVTNSLVVIGIGVLVHRVLGRVRPAVAWGYLLARIVEGVVLAVGVAMLVAGRSGANELAYQLAMLGLAIGSIPFCRALHRDLRLPGWLAGWGAGGYLLLGVGMLLQLFRLIGPTAGVLLSVPGGLFEIALGMTLAVAGLPSRPAGAGAAPGRVTTGAA